MSEFRIRTERRLARQGETYILGRSNPLLFVAHRDHIVNHTEVVVEVERIEDPGWRS